MRGKPGFRGHGLYLPGITPAHAGKTGSSAAALHLRAGSPPRMRGKLEDAAASCSCAGITPAHAGKTWFAPKGSQHRQDHPRACGENVTPPSQTRKSRGSPPRMRGKPNGVFVFSSGQRITPAHAGKTRIRIDTICKKRDHPRACGENPVFPTSVSGTSGSPPRMRGKLLVQKSTIKTRRITPAHAGKTSLG